MVVELAQISIGPSGGCLSGAARPRRLGAEAHAHVACAGAWNAEAAGLGLQMTNLVLSIAIVWFISWKIPSFEMDDDGGASISGNLQIDAG